MKKILVLFLISLILTACGDTVAPTAAVSDLLTAKVETLNASQVTTTQAGQANTPRPTVTAGPTITPGPINTPRSTATALPKPGSEQVYVAPTLAQPGATPASAVTPAGPKIGLELVGQTASDSRFKAVVTGVDTFIVLNDSKGQPTIKPQGYFLIVSFDLENIGKDPASILIANIVDGKGRKFTGTSNTDAILSVAFSDKYKSDINIQPGLKGKSYTVYEVPADATGFKLTLGF